MRLQRLSLGDQDSVIGVIKLVNGNLREIRLSVTDDKYVNSDDQFFWEPPEPMAAADTRAIIKAVKRFWLATRNSDGIRLVAMELNATGTVRLSVRQDDQPVELVDLISFAEDMDSGVASLDVIVNGRVVTVSSVILEAVRALLAAETPDYSHLPRPTERVFGEPEAE